jgi:hypothetical protein
MDDNTYEFYGADGWKQYISKGNGSFEETIDTKFMWVTNNAGIRSKANINGVNIDGGSFLQDMNGDGRADLVTMETNRIGIFYSTGNGFSDSNSKTISVTGEGLVTSTNSLSNNNNRFLAYITGNKVKTMNFIRDEQKEAFLTKAGNTQVDYDRIDMSGKNGKYFYNLGSGATFPYRNIEYEPLYVVTNAKTSSGNTVISNYD